MSRTRTSQPVAGGFLRHIRLDPDANIGRYPFTLPVVAQLARTGGLELDPRVTFVVGDNGTGNSTLVEALAVAAGFNAEGGSQSFQFVTRATESSLSDHLVLRWGTSKPRTGFFLRAESFYNVATEIDRLDQESPYPLLPAEFGVHPVCDLRLQQGVHIKAGRVVARRREPPPFPIRQRAPRCQQVRPVQIRVGCGPLRDCHLVQAIAEEHRQPS